MIVKFSKKTANQSLQECLPDVFESVRAELVDGQLTPQEKLAFVEKFLELASLVDPTPERNTGPLGFFEN